MNREDYNMASSSKLSLVVDVLEKSPIKSNQLSEERLQIKKFSHTLHTVVNLDKNLMLEEDHAIEELEDDVIITNQILVPKAPPRQYNTR